MLDSSGLDAPLAGGAAIPSVEVLPTVVILVSDEAAARAAEAALAAAGLDADAARIDNGTEAPHGEPVLFVAESIGDIDHAAVTAAVGYDVILRADVPSQLALRVELLRERMSRRRARLASAERLRSATMALNWGVHGAESVDDLGRILTSGLARVFGAHAGAIVLFGEPELEPEVFGAPDFGWSSRGDAVPELVPLVQAQLEGRLRDAAVTPGFDAVVELSGRKDRELLTQLFGASARRAIASPVGSDGGRVTGAIFLADAAHPPRRTAFERSLLGYLGAQVARAVDELRVRDRESEAQKRLHETSAELQRLLDEMDDLGVVIRSIADAVNVGVLFYDNENHPKLHNRMVDTMLGLTGFDPKTGLSTHVYASDRRTRVKRDKNIISETLEGDQRGLIYWIGDPEGEQRAIVTEAHAITRPGGEQLGSAVVTYDVTDLANAIEIREEYLATVSHELRTPLTSIVGYLDLIDDEFDVKGLGFGKEFRTIQRNAEQMLVLIRDLLSTSTRELSLRIEPTDLSALLAQSVSVFRPALETAHHRLELRTPATAVLAHLDAGRVKQVVDNLISNAIKYTPEGGTITVSLDRDEERATITVADSGRGISKSDQARLFDRFFRSRDVREAAIQGVGIGLTIVKTIVDAHGGRISVESEAGHGSTFRVELPLRAVETPLTALPLRP